MTAAAAAAAAAAALVAAVHISQVQLIRLRPII
jgi:hypothetical protein